MTQPTDHQLSTWYFMGSPRDSGLLNDEAIRQMCFELLQRRLQEQRLIHAINILRNANEDDRLAAHIEGMAVMLGLDAARFDEGLDF